MGRPVLHFCYPCIFRERRTPVTDDHGHPVLIVLALPVFALPPLVDGIIVVRGLVCDNAVNVNVIVPPPAHLLCNHH